MAKFAIIVYSTYGHIYQLAEEAKKGIESTGSTADILQVAEILSKDILELIHAPEKRNYPIATPENIVNYDGYLFGFPTRFGNYPAQFNTFLDSLGGLWASGALYHKPAGLFVSSAGSGSQEITTRSFISFLTHHGLIYVPLGYGKAFADLANVEEIHGGSPWGAGTIAGSDGSRQPSELELRLASTQGSEFSSVATKLSAPAKAPVKTTTTETAPAAAATTTTAPAETEAKSAAPAAKTETTTTPATKTEKESSGCCVIV